MIYDEAYFENLYNNDFDTFVEYSQSSIFVDDYIYSLDTENLYKRENMYSRLFDVLTKLDVTRITNFILKNKEYSCVENRGEAYDRAINTIKHCFDFVIELNKMDSTNIDGYFNFIETGFMRCQLRTVKGDDEDYISYIVELFVITESGSNSY